MELPVKSPESDRRKTQPYTITTVGLSYHLPQSPYLRLITKKSPPSPKFIVKNADIEARPGQITAIAGPSGAGKTTLLEILAGKIPPAKFSGQVLINDSPINAHGFRRLSGHVTQDDTLFPNLTVEETLTYSALLRLPKEEKRMARDRVRLLLTELGLGRVAGSRVGDGSGRGISGGERRRVSIGVELVHDPSVLLVDEPTSGLDSGSALNVVSVLRVQAVSRGKTVVMTIHQPGFRILELIDRLVLLSKGTVIHHGSLKSLEGRLKSMGHRIPARINVLEYAIDEIAANPSEVRIDEPGRPFDGSRKIEGWDSTQIRHAASPILQEIATLSQRFGKNIFRTKELFLTRVVQAILVGAILGSIYTNVDGRQGREALQTRLGFFAFSLSFLLSSTTEGLPIFLQERRIFTRETMRGSYRVSSYVIANAVVFLPFLLLVAVLYSTAVYWFVGLRRDAGGFLYFALAVWVVVLASNSFTSFCSALVPNFIMGTSVIAGLMGSFFLFSGYFISKEKMPEYWVFMHYLSLFKYPFEGLVVNEYGGRENGLKCLERNVNGVCVMNGSEYLRRQGFEESKKWSNLGVMLGFVVGYRVLCFLVLWYRSYRTTK